ncbi:MAG: hypothetical protein O3C32_05380 [Bacteroidetes bacterium]|jgi:hypothetical protein|nr:hypothetical protein [Bacteroidota bacterium]
MKFILGCIFLGIGCLHAQGTLQFNRILLVSSLDTVPSNKVWKVSSVLSSSQLHTNAPSTAISTAISINGSTVFVSGRSYTEQSADGNQSFGTYTQMPIWLPAQTTLAAGANALSISVIEFNVLP